MSLAWKLNLPSTAKLVYLALCDNANDSGECFPSIPMLAQKCSLTERAVMTHLKSLEGVGLLRREQRAGRSTVYHLNPRTSFTPEQYSPLNVVHPTPEYNSPPPLNNIHPTPERRSPITIKEPSIEPSKNHKGEFTPPDWVPKEQWAAYVEMRKLIKKPMTQKAAEWAVRDLAKLRDAGNSPERVLEQSVVNSWQGLFELKRKPGMPARESSKQSIPSL